MIRIILRALRAGVVTVDYPTSHARLPERFRGAPELRRGAPFGTLPLPSVCPVGALVATGEGQAARFSVDLARCVFCGHCAEGSSEGAIAVGADFELSARRREDLVLEVVSDAEGRTAAPPPRAPHLPNDLETRAAAAIRRTLGRSLALRHLDAGSCNGCDWELTALLNPVYDVRRLGIDVVASPRHADGLLVTGSVTRNLEAAVQRTYEAVPEPRVVIAVGACAASGGIAPKSYASAGGVGEVLPVDVYIPGCPPRPEAIIYGILVALGRLEARRS
ncbi:MAG: hypothetical protein CO108_21780 [Deltaproteobacteria bacterium CG_4_9_14_3_um_filter_63_12]|nr:MAG: hypothetical protein CO108_21780 [Deltaproteobacteria bacterium CG_4_9_14_3_um_filter_63_12]